MRRLSLLVIAFFVLLLVLPRVAIAQNGITVLSSGYMVVFPYGITFDLEVEGSAEITDIDLEYRLNRLSLVPVSCRVDVDFTPGKRVSASYDWNMQETGGLPPGAEVEYWWRVEDASGSSIETPPATIAYDDLRFDWKSLSSGQLTLYWYQGDETFAQELVDAADEALQRLASDIGVSLERAVKVYIYASSHDLLGALVFPYEWTGGLAFTDFGIIAIGIAPDDLTWGRRAMAHELAHLVIHQAVFGPFGDLPTWLDEGLAVHAEGELGSTLGQRLEEAISRDELISVRSLASSFPADLDEAVLSYAESYSVVQFLLDDYGRERMQELLGVFREGSSYDDALMEVYGFDTDGLEARWRESLGLGPWPTATPDAGGGFLGCSISLKTGSGPSDGWGLIALGALILAPAMVFALGRMGRGR